MAKFPDHPELPFGEKLPEFKSKKLTNKVKSAPPPLPPLNPPSWYRRVRRRLAAWLRKLLAEAIYKIILEMIVAFGLALVGLGAWAHWKFDFFGWKDHGWKTEIVIRRVSPEEK